MYVRGSTYVARGRNSLKAGAWASIGTQLSRKGFVDLAEMAFLRRQRPPTRHLFRILEFERASQDGARPNSNRRIRVCPGRKRLTSVAY